MIYLSPKQRPMNGANGSRGWVVKLVLELPEVNL